MQILRVVAIAKVEGDRKRHHAASTQNTREYGTQGVALSPGPLQSFLQALGRHVFGLEDDMFNVVQRPVLVQQPTFGLQTAVVAGSREWCHDRVTRQIEFDLVDEL